MLEFKSADQFNIAGRGLAFSINDDVSKYEGKLLGQPVLVDGDPYLVQGVETHSSPTPTGPFGLLVKPIPYKEAILMDTPTVNNVMNHLTLTDAQVATILKSADKMSKRAAWVYLIKVGGIVFVAREGYKFLESMTRASSPASTYGASVPDQRGPSQDS